MMDILLAFGVGIAVGVIGAAVISAAFAAIVGGFDANPDA